MQTKPLIAALSFFILSQGAQAIPTVGFDSAITNVQLGESFTLTLQGTGFDFTTDSKVIDNITGGQKFNLAFDPSQMEILSISIDPRWTFTSGNKTGTVDNVAGTVTGIAFGTFPATTDDSFNIASISFRTLSAGQQTVSIIGGEFAAKVGGLAGAKILPAFDSATVQISAVPEPGQWAMMLAGLGLVGWRLRTR